MERIQKKQVKALNKELTLLQKQEDKLMASAVRARPAGWKQTLEEKVPAKAYQGLQKAFCEGFSLVFRHGRKAIELTYKKGKLEENHRLHVRRFQEEGKRKELRQMHKQANRSGALNMTMTTLEGIGLGALGVGMPDIVLFLTTVLRGIYETALNYGYGYESRFEQMLILKMMAASLASGEEWFRRNREVNEWLLLDDAEISDEAFQNQIQTTASVFAVDMLILKFIQGLPVVGVLGGAANPVYYRKILRYVRLKYKRRYLLGQHQNI